MISQWEYLLGLREHGNYSREGHGQQIKPRDIVILKSHTGVGGSWQEFQNQSQVEMDMPEQRGSSF